MAVYRILISYIHTTFRMVKTYQRAANAVGLGCLRQNTYNSLVQFIGYFQAKYYSSRMKKRQRYKSKLIS